MNSQKTILLEVICLFSDCEISYLSPERRIENILTEVFNFIHCSSQVKLTAINEQFNTLPRNELLIELQFFHYCTTTTFKRVL